jgi:hypothetical protein
MVSANTQAIEDLTPRVKDLEDEVLNLYSDAETEGSVENKIQSALSWEDVV